MGDLDILFQATPTGTVEMTARGSYNMNLDAERAAPFPNEYDFIRRVGNSPNFYFGISTSAQYSQANNIAIAVVSDMCALRKDNTGHEIPFLNDNG